MKNPREMALAIAELSQAQLRLQFMEVIGGDLFDDNCQKQRRRVNELIDNLADILGEDKYDALESGRQMYVVSDESETTEPSIRTVIEYLRNNYSVLNRYGLKNLMNDVTQGMSLRVRIPSNLEPSFNRLIALSDEEKDYAFDAVHREKRW